MEESEGETVQAYFPEQVREYHLNNGESEGLYERMTVPPDTDVYLEIEETAKDP